MKSRKRSPYSEDVSPDLGDPEDIERFTAAKSLLQRHRIHTRDIFNGKDFLFSGPADELHAALRDLLEIEHRRKRFLQFNYAQVDEYFLLRIVGSKEHQDAIATYFD